MRQLPFRSNRGRRSKADGEILPLGCKRDLPALGESRTFAFSHTGLQVCSSFAYVKSHQSSISLLAIACATAHCSPSVSNGYVSWVTRNRAGRSCVLVPSPPRNCFSGRFPLDNGTKKKKATHRHKQGTSEFKRRMCFCVSGSCLRQPVSCRGYPKQRTWFGRRGGSLLPSLLPLHLTVLVR